MIWSSNIPIKEKIQTGGPLTKPSLSFVVRGRVQQMSCGGTPFPQQTAKHRQQVILHDFLYLHCQRSTPEVLLQNTPFVVFLYSKVFNLFTLSQAATSSAVTFGKLLHGLMDLIFRHLTIRTMAVVQTFNSKFLSDLRLGKKTAYGSIHLIIIVFTSIIPSHSNRRWSPQRKIVFIKLSVNVPAIYKITDTVFLFNFNLENNLSMHRCIYRWLNIPGHRMRM